MTTPKRKTLEESLEDFGNSLDKFLADHADLVRRVKEAEAEAARLRRALDDANDEVFALRQIYGAQVDA